jgi:hypothetical protein
MEQALHVQHGCHETVGSFPPNLRGEWFLCYAGVGWHFKKVSVIGLWSWQLSPQMLLGP